MGRAIDTIAGAVTNSTSLTAVTMATGDSNVIRSYPFTGAPSAHIENVWGKQATAGAARVRSPRLHDNVQGLRFASVGTAARALVDDEFEQVLYPQDALVIELTSGAADSSVLVVQNYYADLPGIDANLRMWDDVKGQIESYSLCQVTIGAPSALGQWGAGTAINATNDNFIVNRMYAVLGYQVLTSVAAVAIRGSDTGNLRVGGPGTTELIETRNWFVRQSRATGLPYIPVFNSANRASVLCDQIDNAAPASCVVDFYLALLRPGALGY